MPYKNILDKQKQEREYYHKNKKYRRVKDWRKLGLKDDPYLVNEYYEESTNCLICDKEFNDLNWNDKKCMNHCHETGYFLNVICWQCNIRDNAIGLRKR